MTHSSPCPTIPPRCSKAAGRQKSWGGGRAGPDPERAGGQRKRDRHEQADDAGAHWTGRGAQLPDQDQAARGDECGRHDIADVPEHKPHPANGPVPEGAAGPMRVGDAAQEQPDRDQGKPEDVDVMRLGAEPGQPGAARQQRALGALGRRPAGGGLA